jgi:hypothetical protein
MTWTHELERPSPLKSGLGFGTFVLLPLILFAGFGWKALDFAESQARKAALQNLERRFFGILHQSDPRVYCSTRLPRFLQAADRQGHPELGLPRLLKAAQNRWPLKLAPYFFDPGGNLVTPSSIAIPNRTVFRNLWRQLMNPAAGGPSLRKEERKIFESLFGSGFNLTRWRSSENTLIPIRHKQQDGFLFWTRWKKAPGGGAIVLVPRLPPPHALFSAFSPELARKGLFLLAPDRARKLRLYGRPLAYGTRARLARMAREDVTEAGFDRLFLRRGYLGLSAIFLGHHFESWLFPWYRALIAAITLVFLGLATLGFRAGLRDDRLFAFPIRVKLVLLFLFSLAIPSAGILFLGGFLLVDRQSVLEGKSIQSAKEELNALDTRFFGEQNRFLKVCRALEKQVTTRWDLSSVEALAKQCRQQDRLIHFEVRNLAGSYLIPRNGQGGLENLNFFLDTFAKTAIEQHLQSRLQTPEGKAFRPPDSKSRQVIEAPDLGFTRIFSEPDKVHPILIGDSMLFWYWRAVAAPGHPVAFMSIFQSLATVQKKFLTRQLGSPSGFQKTGLTRVVFSPGGNCFPERFSYQTNLQPFRALLARTGKPVQAHIRLRGRPFLLVGQPGRHLENFALFALIPAEGTTRAINRLRGHILSGLGIGFLVALLIGIMLAHHFLAPIAALHRGMTALQHREVGYRVPLSFPDEFGHLAQTFNLMLEDLKEMELARVVQNSLIPRVIPAVAGYQVALKNLVATDLGGDYCDVLPLPDGRVLFLMGDVTGHGVAAALGMTLAKSVAFQFAREGGEPSELLLRLNRVVFKAFNRKKMMTFFAGILSPDTGLFRFANAGHPYPVLKKPDGSLQELAQANYPLGTTPRRFTAHHEEISLGAGDLLFLYTDGLFEGTDAQGNQFGFINLHRIIRECLEINPDAFLHHVLKKVQASWARPELEDDVTLLVLRREEPTA